MNRVLRVLVVDDSAYIRKTIKQILSRSPFIEVVGIAGDGEEALEKVKELHPDVVTLDLMMPGLDGLGFLTRQMASIPLAGCCGDDLRRSTRSGPQSAGGRRRRLRPETFPVGNRDHFRDG